VTRDEQLWLVASAQESGLVPSMGSIGDCFDNAVIESFWARMQVELLNRRRWKTRVELANAIFEYLEIFHNRQRRYSALGMRTPIEHETTPLPNRSGMKANKLAPRNWGNINPPLTRGRLRSLPRYHLTIRSKRRPVSSSLPSARDSKSVVSVARRVPQWRQRLSAPSVSASLRWLLRAPLERVTSKR
jgi:Integrase core domain